MKKKIILITIAILLSLIALDYFFDRFTLQSPILIKFQSPITPRIQSPKSTMPKNAQNLTKKAGVSVVSAGDKQNLQMAKNKQKMAQNQKSEKEIILSRKNGEVLWKIYGLESSWGRNDYCRQSGKGYGGFGVMNNKEVVCYESFEKAVERAEYWFENALKTAKGDLATALCYWNLGELQVNCKYYQAFLTL
ncbi:MAG: hypothetical protein QXY47_05340 [Thermoplasmata archaeon]